MTMVQLMEIIQFHEKDQNYLNDSNFIMIQIIGYQIIKLIKIDQDDQNLFKWLKLLKWSNFPFNF